MVTIWLHRSYRSDRLELLDCSINKWQVSGTVGGIWSFDLLCLLISDRILLLIVNITMSHHRCRSLFLSWNSNQSRKKNLVETSSGLRLRKVLTRFLKSLKCFWFGCSRKISRFRRNTGSFISLRMAGDSEGSLSKKISAS